MSRERQNTQSAQWIGRRELIILACIAATTASLLEPALSLAVWSTWAARLILLAALTAAGIVDLRTKRVPRLISYPLLTAATGRLLASANIPAVILILIAMLDLRIKPGVFEKAIHLTLFGVGLYRGLRALNVAYFVPVAATLLSYYMWRANWLGGGDGKLLIGLGGLYPDPGLLIAIAAGWLAVGTFWIVRAYGPPSLPAVSTALQAPARSVSRAELEEQGVPMTLGITVGWAIHLCFLIASEVV